MIEALMTRTVTIQHRAYSGTDAHGSPSLSTTSSDDVAGYIEQRRLTPVETEGRQDTARADYLLILPAGTTIDHTDRVVVDGTTYEVVDIPWKANRAITGSEHHIEVIVRQVEG